MDVLAALPPGVRRRPNQRCTQTPAPRSINTRPGRIRVQYRDARDDRRDPGRPDLPRHVSWPMHLVSGSDG